MTCHEARRLLHPLIDGELDVIHQVEIEEHLRECASCARAYENLRTLKSQASDPGLRFRAPAALRARIEKLAASPSDTVRRRRASAPRLARLWPRGWAAPVALAAAALLLVVSGAWFLQARRSAENVFAQQVVAAHVRSLLPGHLTDVTSTDQHNVKPWFAGRVDFSPPVPDLAASGFPLVGGRLDYVGSRTVAVLVYKRRQHVLNLFVWPSNGYPGVASATINGYHVLSWNGAALTWAVVSDVNPADLRQFEDLVRGATVR